MTLMEGLISFFGFVVSWCWGVDTVVVTQGLVHCYTAATFTQAAFCEEADIHTNTNAQVGYRTNQTDGVAYLSTLGWTYRRGRDAQ